LPQRHLGKWYGFEVKLRCVKLSLEEGAPVSLLSKEEGLGNKRPAIDKRKRERKHGDLGIPSDISRNLLQQ